MSMSSAPSHNFLTGILLAVAIFVTGFSSCKLEQSPTSPTDQLSNEVIIDWNQLTYQVAFEHDQFYSFIGIRTLTMVHLAMHNVLNAIEPQYQTYSFTEKQPGADPTAATSQAAYEILLKTYPQRQDTLDLILNKWLSQIPEGEAKNLGINLGKQAAASMWQLREGDGHQKQGDYTPMTKPGDYQYTPGWDEWVLKPDFDYARPFSMDSVTQFRSPPPPPISGEVYANSFNEVKQYGRKNSTIRSPDQTAYAHWWAEFGEHSWNRIGRITARERKLPIHETARMFALINMDIYDIYLGSLESKYHYDTWRPYTAIRAADTDENPQTDMNADWEPEMLTPPWPEYPSAHASVGAGGAEILTHVYGTPDVAFSMESVSALPDAPVRSYQNLDVAAKECADSRIMNGYHFRFATEEGKKQGRKIARHLCEHYLQPL